MIVPLFTEDMKNIDNIIIGNMVDGVTLQMLGVEPCEDCVMVSELDAAELNFFLPRILVKLGLFNTTSEIKRISKDREHSKIVDPDERILWRTLDKPELTRFKIGKRLFWLIVGDIKGMD